jgi:hypothetical protein
VTKLGPLGGLDHDLHGRWRPPEPDRLSVIRAAHLSGPTVGRCADLISRSEPEPDYRCVYRDVISCLSEPTVPLQCWLPHRCGPFTRRPQFLNSLCRGPLYDVTFRWISDHAARHLPPCRRLPRLPGLRHGVSGQLPSGRGASCHFGPPRSWSWHGSTAGCMPTFRYRQRTHADLRPPR